MAKRPFRRRVPTRQQVQSQQNPPASPYRPGTRPEDVAIGRDLGTRDLPVAYDPGSGAIIPPNSPPGFLPPGWIPGPDPGTMVLPQDKTVPDYRFRGGSKNVPGTPIGPVPIPGHVPGQQTPPPGSVPGPTPGTYITPGTPGNRGGRGGYGRVPPTPPSAPIPYDPGVPSQGPPLPQGHPAGGQGIPPFPSPPDPDAVAAYHRMYGGMAPTKSPYIDPQQLYGYNRKAAAAYAGLSPAKGKAHVRQQITDHYKRTQLDPWVDQALMSGMGNLISGMTPNPPAVPPRTFGGFPVPGTGSPAGPIPWLDPANYPGGVPPWGGGGGGGGMLPGIPPLSDILGDIGGALLPNFGAPQGGVPPQGGMPPQGAMPMGPARSVGGQPTIGGPQFP